MTPSTSLLELSAHHLVHWVNFLDIVYVWRQMWLCNINYCTVLCNYLVIIHKCSMEKILKSNCVHWVLFCHCPSCPVEMQRWWTWVTRWVCHYHKCSYQTHSSLSVKLLKTIIWLQWSPHYISASHLWYICIATWYGQKFCMVPF